MRNGSRLLLALACVAVGVPCGRTRTYAQEPSTNARPLHEWVEILGHPVNMADYANAKQVIQYLGTNAFPSLIEWLAYDPGPPADTALYAWRPLPGAYGDQRRFALANSAVEAFRILGQAGAPALPSLSNVVVIGQSRRSTPRAIQAMSNIGPAALPTLLAILTNGPPDASQSVPFAIAGLGPNAKPALPALILCLTNSEIRYPALRVLAYLGSQGVERQLVFTAITNLVRDPDRGARCEALRMLHLFEPEARTALPQILAALHDPDEYVRKSASDILAVIASEALTNAPAR